jgi:hypothetical protein
MSRQGNTGMTPATARKVEYVIIGLGVLALLMIFQPFNIVLFTIGCILVVVAGLINNLLPLARPGVPGRSVVKAAMIVAMIFCVVLVIAIFAAHLYGVFFLKAPDPNTVMGKAQLAAAPWYMHPFTWTVAAIAIVLPFLLRFVSRNENG